MTKLADCIEAAVATGKISQEAGDEILAKVERHTEQLELTGGYSPEAARRLAENSALAAKQAELKQAKRQKALQILAVHRATQNITGHPEGAATGAFSLLGRDITRKATYSNVDRRAKAVSKELQARFAEPMDKLRTKFLGLFQDKTTMRNMVRELFGTSTGDANAAAFAKAWGDVAEYARQRFNRAGGAIPKRDDWGMPQWHDPLRVQKMGKEAWKDFVTPLLNRDKMLNADGVRLNDMEIETALDAAFDRITTGGLVDLVPGKSGGKKLGNRRQDSRFLVFKDGDAWLEYSDRLGRADLFATLTDHMEGMAHDIGLLEILGPNPEHTFRVIRDMAKKDGLDSVRLATLDALYNTVSGKVDDTASLRFADIAGGVRNWLTSARLGSAMLSAVSDIQFLRQTSRWTGMSPMKVMTRQLSMLNPANAEDRLLAVKMGLGAEAWITRALAANRFTEVTGSGFSARVADFTMRASGLSAWTDAGKKAFAMELYGVFGDNAGKQFDELAPLFRRELERFGFSADDWDLIRATDMLEHKGAKFLSTENLIQRTDLDEAKRLELVNKIQEMQSELSVFAVPEPDARARALTTAGKARGTLAGEGMRFVSQFKSFPVSVILSHFYRGMYEEGAKTKAKYLAQMIIGTTALGVVALQSKEISKGRDPKPLDANLLGAAFLQGGGAGIYGDFLYSGVFGTSRFGQSMLTSMAGPGAGLIFSDIPRVTTGQFGEMVEGRDPKVMADMIRFTKSYLPGGSLWYLRLGLERTVFDQLELMADPKARSKFSRRERRYRKELGQEYWWRPGTTAPQRAPEFGD